MQTIDNTSLLTESPSDSHIFLQKQPIRPKIKPLVGFRFNPIFYYWRQKTHSRTKQRENVTAHRYLSGSSNFQIQNSWFSRLISSKSLLKLRFSECLRSLEDIHRVDFLFKRLQLFRGLRFILIPWKPEELRKTLNAISHSFVKIRYLTSFSFELRGSSEPSPKLFRKLGVVLQTMSSLRNLRISYFNEKSILENIISSILEGALRKLKSLTTFSLKLAKVSMNNQEIEALCSGLLLCKSLANVDIELDQCPNLTNEGIKKLFVTWRDLELASFKLKLRACKDVNEGIIFGDFDSLMKTEEDLNLSVLSKFESHGQKTTLKLIRKHPKTRNSQVFELFVFQRKRSEKEVLNDISSLKFIKTLNLKICEYVADDNLTQKLAKSLKLMESLENLTLEIEANKNFDNFDSIIPLFGIFERLKTFELKFKGFKLTDQQVRDLCFHVFQMKSLITLNLDLEECQLNNHKIFEILGKLEFIHEESGLKKLNLAFSGNPENIKEETGFFVGFKKIFQKEKENGVEDFWKFLRSLGELKSLNFKLRNIDFSNKEQREFANGLWMLENLKNNSQIEFEFDYLEKDKARIFENLTVKSGYLRTLRLQFQEEKEKYEKEIRKFDFKIPAYGFSFQLKLSFRKCYNEARREITLLQNLADFLRKIGSISIGYKKEQKVQAISSICVDNQELEWIEVTTPADQSFEILNKFLKVVLLEGPKLQKYSTKIYSKNLEQKFLKKNK